MVKVSICIPAYNNEASVRRLLASIERQTYKDYEVIITDDSDGDGIKRLAEEKKYIKYYKNEKRLGATANWNASIDRSCGEYIKIMHHDDWFTDENSLKAFVDMLEEHPEADLAFSGSRQMEADRSFDRYISEKDVRLIEKDHRNLFLGNTIGAPSAVIVRRNAVVHYDEKLTWLVDMEYYMQILKKNPHFLYTKEPLVSIGIGQGQLTESCRDDRDLNTYEYGYIYEKYQLGSEKQYRQKLIKIFADAGKCWDEIAGYGISSKEYKMEERRKLVSKIKWKLTHCLSWNGAANIFVVLFVISLLPILMLSAVNHATGDDFGYGRLTHEAWQATHSLFEVGKAACETVRQFYYGWQGTWLSIFLFSLQPEVFSSKAYVIVPTLMLILWLGSTGILFYYVMVKKAGLDKKFSMVLYLLFAMAGIQFVPSTKSAIFWYNGTAHYIVPYAIALSGIFFYLKFMDRREGWNYGAYVGLAVCMTLLGGVNYQAALLVPIIVVLASIFYWKEKENRKRAAVCIFPLAAEAAGLIISMKSPGNKNRGGEDFGFSFLLAAKTIFQCFVRGIVQAGQYVKAHPLLLIIFVTAAIVLWETLKIQKEKKKYPLPIVFVLLSYCVYCAMFAPELYAGVEVSGGVYNMNYYTFLFMVFGNLLYIEGAVICRQEKKEAATEKVQNSKLILISAILGIVYIFAVRSDIKNTTTFQCMEYIRSGQAADFKEQMELQQSVLLDDNVKDVVLPLLNDDQGPLMHMPLTENPEAWTNSVIKMFYGKDSVVAVPGEIWQEIKEQGLE